jgi:hypothetical protein
MTTNEQGRSRRAVLAGSLGAGVAAAAGTVIAAGSSERAPSAHGGIVHGQNFHGGITHSHDEYKHNHAIMAHALDPQTLRAVDIGTNG